MLLGDIYGPDQFGLSIEIFPPKTPDGDAALLKTLEQLAGFRPGFISCTYGAGGSTRDRTVEWCEQIQQQFNVPATAHFTCVGASRDQLIQWLDHAVERGVRNIMALRGDAPENQAEFHPAPDGLRHANELVELIRGRYPEVGIGVAGYPEKHPEAQDLDTDLAHLKRKVDAGADAVFTQLFYDNDAFLRFRDRCQAAGIAVPIVPGIMPITEFARIRRITSLCGAVIPGMLEQQLQAVQDDQAAQFEIGVGFAIEQCRRLIDEGVPGIHLYVLNRVRACREILDALGLNPQNAESAV